MEFLYLPKELLVLILRLSLLDKKSKLFDLLTTCKQFNNIRYLLLLKLDCSCDNYPKLCDAHLIDLAKVLTSIYLNCNEMITK